MKLWTFEGTSEEFAAVAPTLFRAFDGSGGMQQVPSSDDVRPDAEPARFVTEEEARHIVTRLQLSQNMQSMLQLLKGAKRRILSSEIRDQIGLTSDQFRGMTGAFGRRVSHSVRGNVQFFDARWEPESGQYSWLLPDTVKSVLRKDGWLSLSSEGK